MKKKNTCNDNTTYLLYIYGIHILHIIDIYIYIYIYTARAPGRGRRPGAAAAPGGSGGRRHARWCICIYTYMYREIYIYRERERFRDIDVYVYLYHIYIYIYIYRGGETYSRFACPHFYIRQTCLEKDVHGWVGPTDPTPITMYGKFSEFHVCFCGLDPGNLKFETVRTHKQRICFQDLRRSIWNFAVWNYENWPYIHPASIKRFPLTRFSPWAGLLRYVFAHW